MNERKFIPGTRPEWGYELPDGLSNSMVAKDGRSVDTGNNFDERDYEESDTGEAELEAGKVKLVKRADEVRKEMGKAAEAANEMKTTAVNGEIGKITRVAGDLE